MTNVLVDDSYLSDIADTIRSKLGVQDTYKPSEMADAIDDIGGGVTPTGTKQISITANGTTTEDVTNYANAEITVNVPGGENLTLIETVTVTSAVSSIYKSFPATDRIVLEISGLSQDNTSNSAVVLWVTMNNSSYAAKKAFSLHQTNNTAGVVFGTQYSCDCIIDMTVYNTLVGIECGGIFGSGNDFTSRCAKRVSDVGSKLTSLYMYLPSQNIASGAVINIWSA